MLAQMFIETDIQSPNPKLPHESQTYRQKGLPNTVLKNVIKVMVVVVMMMWSLKICFL